MRTLTAVELAATALILTACGLLVQTTAAPVIQIYLEDAEPPRAVPVHVRSAV